MKGKKLTRSKNDQKIFGVCGGFAEYFGLDPALVRVLWALSCLASAGSTALVYAVAAVLLPEQGESGDNAGQDGA
jgi:phage shock protein PspC (stress-responsive transcriptional regulator)